MINESNPNLFNFYDLGLENIEVASYRMLGGYYLLKIQGSDDPFKVATLLSNNSNFEYIEFDALGKYLDTPNDPHIQ